MEQGLLSRLQSYFSSSYGGRYVEHIIKEMLDEQPRLKPLLFGQDRSSQVRAEFRFEIGGKTRVADLAFLDAATERPTCLVEIKYDDHKNPSNSAQLDDYLKYCARRNCKFISLSQHILPTTDRRKLSGSSVLLFSDIAEYLDHADGATSGLLKRFFIDRGLIMHKFKNEDMDNLRAFVFRLLNPWLGQGRSQTKSGMSSGGVADAFGHVLKNMNIVSGEVVANASSRSPTIDFDLDPWMDTRRIRRTSEANSKDRSVSGYAAKSGGYLYVYGRNRLDDRSDSWLQVEFGFVFEANKGDRNLGLETFAIVYSNALGGDASQVNRSAPKRILSDKNIAVASIRRRIVEAAAHALKRNLLPKYQASRLKKYRDAMR